MDLQNLENYPVYILNVVPELSEEANVQIPEQITSNEPLSYNFYVPNVEHHNPILSHESVQQGKIIRKNRKNNTKLMRKLSYEKLIRNTVETNNQNFEAVSNTFTEKSLEELSTLIQPDDIKNTNDEVLVKFDPKTNTNVVFHLVRPEIEANPVEIKVPKRGRPRKNVTESNKSDQKQDESSKPFKPEDIIEYPLTATKSGRVCKPPRHLLSGEKIVETRKNPFPFIDNNDILGRKKVKYNVKSDFVCERCGKTYLGHKRMQEHLERCPAHKMTTAEQQVDSQFQDIFQTLHETPIDTDIINGKKEIHTQTEVYKDRHCAYIKSKKNLAFHLKQVMKHVKKSNLIKSLCGAISIWDLLSCTLESGNLQEFSKELNTLLINLKSITKSFKLVSTCKSDPIDNNQMFVDDTVGYLLGLPKGTYGLQTIQNEFELDQSPDVWSMNCAKTVESKVPTSQNINHHSSPIHLNLFDSQSSKVDFLLSSSMEESIMCEASQAVLESVDGLVSERLRTMSDHLHSNVPIIDYPIVSTSSTSNVSQPDSFMNHGVYEVYTNDLNLVPTSTEDFIKSLEQFEPLNDTDNTLSTETRMLDFEDLQHTFHTALNDKII